MPHRAAELLWHSDLYAFLTECHEGDAPFFFRLEVKSAETKTEFVKKLGASLEKKSDWKLANSTTDYEIEIRLIEAKDGSFVPFLKLYSMKMKRFAYRKNAIAMSIHPATAAMLMYLAKPYLKEDAQILDPCCGVGTMLIERDILVPAREKYGIDIFGDALDMARENMELRKKVEAGIKAANTGFVIAKAGMNEQTLSTALMAPKQEVRIALGDRNVMSVDIPVYDYKTKSANSNDIYSYGFAFTSGELDDAVKSLSDILPDMLRLAEVEKSCQMLAAEIEKTRRRVNALEHVIIPETREGIKYISMKLDENERSTQVRLMKVKDMMLEEAHHYKEHQFEHAQ